MREPFDPLRGEEEKRKRGDRRFYVCPPDKGKGKKKKERKSEGPFAHFHIPATVLEKEREGGCSTLSSMKERRGGEEFRSVAAL